MWFESASWGTWEPWDAKPQEPSAAQIFHRYLVFRSGWVCSALALLAVGVAHQRTSAPGKAYQWPPKGWTGAPDWDFRRPVLPFRPRPAVPGSTS